MSQKTVQTMPSSPVTAKETRQLKVPISHATRGKDSAAPMREPLSKMLAAMARSRARKPVHIHLGAGGIGAGLAHAQQQPETRQACGATRGGGEHRGHGPPQDRSRPAPICAPILSASQPNGICIAA